MMPFASIVLAGCLAVGAHSDHVLAGDLAAAFPALAGVPPATPLGFAPAPGAARTFHIPELRALAQHLGIAAAPAREICVVQPAAPLEPPRLIEAMRRTLPDAAIEITDFSRQPAPAGEIEFPLAGLRYTAPQSLWFGSIRYGGNRRFAVWARVRIACRVPRVVARADLQAGRPIAAGQVAVEMRDGLPEPAVFAQSVAQVEGKCPRVPIRAGLEIRALLLENPQAVRRGDAVRVEVRSGGARLDFQALAETSGAVGETVLLRNPFSQKPFRATVEDRDRVRVTAGVTP